MSEIKDTGVPATCQIKTKSGILPVIRLANSKFHLRQGRPCLHPFDDDVEAVIASIPPICFDTYDAQATLHGRRFSATGSGSVEDPVTGTASGVMGVYYRKFMKPTVSELMITVEQGHEIGRSGQVRIHVSGQGLNHNDWKIEMDGKAVFVGVKKVGEEEADVETLHLGF